MSEPLYGSAFAYAGVGCVLLGPSGSGKSRIIAESMQFGARLVADDRIILSEQSGMLMASAPPELTGVLELRGLGLMRVNDAIPRHVVHLVVELSLDAPDRLPERETRSYLGHEVPYIRIEPALTSASVLLHYIKAMQEGRILPADWRPESR